MVGYKTSQKLTLRSCISRGPRDAQLKSTAAQLYEKSYEKVHDFEVAQGHRSKLTLPSPITLTYYHSYAEYKLKVTYLTWRFTDSMDEGEPASIVSRHLANRTRTRFCGFGLEKNGCHGMSLRDRKINFRSSFITHAAVIVLTTLQIW